jgi:SAM-dependent methyltransferase
VGDTEATLNREHWSRINAAYTDPSAEKSWASEEITWGVFEIPERTLDVLGDVSGLDVVELGCGTAYFSAWLARRGARPVGVDITPAQLDTARRCQQKFGLAFPLVEASGESVPLPDQSFDLVLSEYGACLWCEPERWVAEAARLLRPDGRLVFLTNALLLTLCLPEGDGDATTALQRSVVAARRIAWLSGGVEYHLGHGEWIALLRRHDFVIERLAELHAPAAVTAHPFYESATPEWALQWPAEELWVARKRD